MSRIGKLPVPIPSGVSVDCVGRSVRVVGPMGTLEQELPPWVSVTQEGSTLVVVREGDDRTARSMHGLARSLVANLVNGAHAGFAKQLEIVGVGYRVEQKGSYLVFSLGYSHPIYYELPAGVQVKVDSPTKLTLSGPDRQAVGGAAAKVRSFRPPEPYKGKGIKYSDEVIRRKEGKSGGR